MRPQFRGQDYLAAVHAVYEERQRQVEQEGFDDAHDDRHNPGDLVRAARCYFDHPNEQQSDVAGRPFAWQWAWAWWKPGDRYTNLVKAGALAEAECERAVRNGYDPAADSACELLGAVFAELANLLMCEEVGKAGLETSDPAEGGGHAEG